MLFIDFINCESILEKYVGVCENNETLLGWHLQFCANERQDLPDSVGPRKNEPNRKHETWTYFGFYRVGDSVPGAFSIRRGALFGCCNSAWWDHFFLLTTDTIEVMRIHVENLPKSYWFLNLGFSRVDPRGPSCVYAESPDTDDFWFVSVECGRFESAVLNSSSSWSFAWFSVELPVHSCCIDYIIFY